MAKLLACKIEPESRMIRRGNHRPVWEREQARHTLTLSGRAPDHAGSGDRTTHTHRGPPSPRQTKLCYSEMVQAIAMKTIPTTRLG